MPPGERGFRVEPLDDHAVVQRTNLQLVSHCWKLRLGLFSLLRGEPGRESVSTHPRWLLMIGGRGQFFKCMSAGSLRPGPARCRASSAAIDHNLMIMLNYTRGRCDTFATAGRALRQRGSLDAGSRKRRERRPRRLRSMRCCTGSASGHRRRASSRPTIACSDTTERPTPTHAPDLVPALRLLLQLLLLPCPCRAQARCARRRTTSSPRARPTRYTLTAEDGELVVRFDIAPGYYLYRDRLAFEIGDARASRLGSPAPAGRSRPRGRVLRQAGHLSRTDRERRCPRHASTARRRISTCSVKLQGCADAGLCYPPQTWTVPARGPVTRGTADAAAAARAEHARRMPPRCPAGTAGIQSARAARRRRADPRRTSCRPTRRSCFRRRAPSRDRVRCAGTSPTTITSIATRSRSRPPRPDVQLGKPSIPGGETKHDEYFGEQVVFHGRDGRRRAVVAAAGVDRRCRSRSPTRAAPTPGSATRRSARQWS